MNFWWYDSNFRWSSVLHTILLNIDSFHDTILEDRQIELTRIDDVLQIYYESWFHIIYDDLGMIKLSIKWIPRCLNATSKCGVVLKIFVKLLKLLVTLKRGSISITHRSKSNTNCGNIQILHNLALKNRLSSLIWNKDGIILIYLIVVTTYKYRGSMMSF